jgi:glutamate--cysteine ligase
LRNVIDRKFERRLAGLINSGERGVLRGGRKGVEKESLRVTPAGDIVQTRHPAALGAPLTNEHITTDFSESLIELVTPPFGETWELLQYLCDIHQFVYRHLNDELLWAAACPAPSRATPAFRWRSWQSSVGRMKTIYRHGLGVRYGRIMQAISGVHFNYSFSPRLWGVLADISQSKLPGQSFVSEQYFGVLRNYRRYGWLVLYLFGTSPAVSKSFCRSRNLSRRARRGYGLRAVRHLAAHERHRLPQQESSDGERVGQQPGRVCPRSVAGDRDAVSAVR